MHLLTTIERYLRKTGMRPTRCSATRAFGVSDKRFWSTPKRDQMMRTPVMSVIAT